MYKTKIRYVDKSVWILNSGSDLVEMCMMQASVCFHNNLTVLAECNSLDAKTYAQNPIRRRLCSACTLSLSLSLSLSLNLNLILSLACYVAHGGGQILRPPIWNVHMGFTTSTRTSRIRSIHTGGMRTRRPHRLSSSWISCKNKQHRKLIMHLDFILGACNKASTVLTNCLWRLCFAG
jgi:hypothetical protein